MTLQQAAALLGVTAATLRWQIRNGQLRATKLGPVWTVTRREVERYRAQHLGRRLQCEQRLCFEYLRE